MHFGDSKLLDYPYPFHWFEGIWQKRLQKICVKNFFHLKMYKMQLYYVWFISNVPFQSLRSLFRTFFGWMEWAPIKEQDKKLLVWAEKTPFRPNAFCHQISIFVNITDPSKIIPQKYLFLLRVSKLNRKIQINTKSYKGDRTLLCIY